MIDPFITLAADYDASPEILRKAYFKAVRQHGPDRDPEGFRAIREAWEAVQTEAGRDMHRVVRIRPPQTDGQELDEAIRREIRQALRHLVLDALMPGDAS